MREPLYHYFVVARGEIVAQLDTLREAGEMLDAGGPGCFILEVRSNLARPAGAMGRP